VDGFGFASWQELVQQQDAPGGSPLVQLVSACKAGGVFESITEVQAGGEQDPFAEA